MEILEFGNTGGRKLVLIHGFESPWQIWEPYIEHYQSEFHVIVPILTGHNVNETEDFVSFERCAKELEDFCLQRFGDQVDAIYGMSMGGVLAGCIWKNKRLRIKKLVLESAPLLSFGALTTRILTRQYLTITHKAQTVRGAVNSMVTAEQLEPFLALLDHISDTTITNCIKAIGRFRLPADLDTPDTRITYYYGGTPGEAVFRSVARYLRTHYANADTICLKGKGHCEDALLNAQRRIEALDRILSASI